MQAGNVTGKMFFNDCSFSRQTIITNLNFHKNLERN